ncbi:hypothetical protein AMEX_G14132 [Astyanax mexicanus]|uniref:Uncharacterized protein n=1 Tax=Astyanax mexicanus TaxID=7994 RepID=A0A8T2LR23_ASTMX|nr:hypothetical protein AMEX_G14132 [Astyanax mexicanus]
MKDRGTAGLLLMKDKAGSVPGRQGIIRYRHNLRDSTALCCGIIRGQDNSYHSSILNHPRGGMADTDRDRTIDQVKSNSSTGTYTGTPLPPQIPFLFSASI